MDRRIFGTACSNAEMEAIGRSVIAQLPDPFRAHLGEIVFDVEDLPDDDTLHSVELTHPYELTGIYEGIPLGEKSIDAPQHMPDRIRLFRLPILAEWAERGNETLEHLIAHVVIHELGHHFGLSDEDMHTLEDQVG